MTRKIFFSWQSDTPNGVGRTMVETCLQRAIERLHADTDVEPAHRMSVDRDTLDVPGSPPIGQVILNKIDEAAFFISDLTYVADRLEGGKSPNPNVCVEHGWALKSLSWRRVISVMNTAYGHPKAFDLPFDFTFMRWPILYDCPPDAAPEVRKTVRDGLTKDIAAALKVMLADPDVLSLMGVEAPADEVDSRIAIALDELHGLAADPFRGRMPVVLTKPKLTVRIAPLMAAERPRLELSKVRAAQGLFPPSVDVRAVEDSNEVQWWTSSPELRAEPGAFSEVTWCMRFVRPGNIEYQMTFGRPLHGDEQSVVDGCQLEWETVFHLERMAKILGQLGLSGPAILELRLDGAEDIILSKARPSHRPLQRRDFMLPHVMVDDLSAPLAPALHDIFDQLWQAAGWPEGSPSYTGDTWQGYTNVTVYRSLT